MIDNYYIKSQESNHFINIKAFFGNLDLFIFPRSSAYSNINYNINWYLDKILLLIGYK